MRQGSPSQQHSGKVDEGPRGAPLDGTKGILVPEAGLERFTLRREPPPDALKPFVVAFWTVQWDLPEGETYRQAILPFPCVNLAYEQGEFLVHGPGTACFVATLSGRGWVTGARFTPAGFSAFSRWPMRKLVDHVEPAASVIGRSPPLSVSSPREARDALSDYLLAQEASPSAEMALADRLVAMAEADARIVTAETLAQEAAMAIRSLHRLLQRYVGVSSKWIVRRARVQNAAERVARGERIDWASTALELGYHDQAHLIRDFRAQIGETPAAYARRCARRTSNEPV
jgi:AraC-like DNA-binding protein